MKYFQRALGAFFLLLFLQGGLLSAPRPAFAEGLSLAADDSTAVSDLVEERIKKKITRGAYFLFGIEEKLKGSSEELSLLKNNMRSLEKKIADSEKESRDLKSQLANLDLLIENNKEKVKAVRLQMAQYANQIALLKAEKKIKERDLEKNIDALREMLTAYYLQANTFFDVRDSSPSLLAFLSDDKTTGQVFQASEYLLFFQKAGQDLAVKILEQQNSIDETAAKIGDEEKTLQDLRELLDREQKTMQDSQTSKERLLEETKGKQLIYETLLELSKKEVESVSVQITHLRENYDFFQAKLDELKNNPAVGAQTFAQEENSLLDDAQPALAGNATFAWPVSPSLGISAFFHDDAYQKAMGVRHDAIDIRIPQGSRVRAPADGVVSKVVDNGLAYSYIIISHPDKFLTLYGHMSEILVTEGEIVRGGQTIGLSGGIPGTKGAGWLTTGAHLHFEVFKNWQHVDPLDYLPLEFVPVASLPEKYVRKAIGEEDKVKRGN